MQMFGAIILPVGGAALIAVYAVWSSRLDVRPGTLREMLAGHGLRAEFGLSALGFGLAGGGLTSSLTGVSWATAVVAAVAALLGTWAAWHDTRLRAVVAEYHARSGRALAVPAEEFASFRRRMWADLGVKPEILAVGGVALVVGAAYLLGLAFFEPGRVIEERVLIIASVELAAGIVGLWRANVLVRSPWRACARAMVRAIYAKPAQREGLFAEMLSLDPESVEGFHTPQPDR